MPAGGRDGTFVSPAAHCKETWHHTHWAAGMETREREQTQKNSTARRRHWPSSAPPPPPAAAPPPPRSAAALASSSSPFDTAAAAAAAAEAARAAEEERAEGPLLEGRGGRLHLSGEGRRSLCATSSLVVWKPRGPRRLHLSG